MTMHQPVGVVGAITPWNYPISMITRKVGPALAAGCTVVLKPAEQTPLCAVAVFQLLAEAGVPPGVCNLVTTSDPAPVGQSLLANAAVRKLTFTGSTEVGKSMACRRPATSSGCRWSSAATRRSSSSVTPIPRTPPRVPRW